MARIRYIKPEFFDDEELAMTSPHARLLFAGLWTRADRSGRLKDEPTRLRAQLFPYEPALDVNALLNELRVIGCVVRYDIEGVRYLAMPGFPKHQNPHKNEAMSRITPPTPEQCRASREQQPSGSRTAPGLTGASTDSPDPGANSSIRVQASESSESAPVVAAERSGRIGIGIEREGNGARVARPPSLVRPRNLNASWEGPIFDLPNAWVEQALARSNGALTVATLQQFAAETTKSMQASGEGVDGSQHLFGWLDRKLSAWRKDAATRAIDESYERDHAESAARRAGLRADRAEAY